ncbi:MAG: F0F1 ATP synthase subunit epsilon [Alphaproteobacteria bacterium]|nr:F0F1 ATP synthase subunit epsilon [Alphaproteobacteria bacterium]MCB9791113.1 F0F1 ATP synthase subunit epsilon [Alphaproteobacteria bacterium]
MTPLHLELRTPSGLVLDQPVQAITAEDRSGWFGIRPGRADVIAVLPPGLLVFRDADGEGFVALAGGLLSLEAGRCRVVSLEAVVARELDAIAEQVAQQARRRRERAALHQGVVRDLAREALRRLLQERP